MKKSLTLSVAALIVAGSYAEMLEDWQFNDANGTALNSVSNSGIVGTSWNYGGPQTQAGSLNIGDATYYKFDPGTGQTFRTAEFSEITSGKCIFEFMISDWDMAGTDGIGTVNNGIKFGFGHSANGAMQLEFEVAQAPGDDIRVRSQNSNNGSLSGTDAQNQLGDLNLTNSASVTVQLEVDLDTGEWSTRVDAGSDGSFVDLVTDGTGMTAINRIQLIVDASNGPWEYGGVAGTATEFIKIDSVSLFQPDAPPVWAVEFDGASITNNKYVGGTNYVLNTTVPTLDDADYTGQTVYAGVEHVLGAVDLTNAVSALTFAKHVNDTWGHGGARIQWNGDADQTGLYEEDDKTTAIVLFKKEDFLNGLDSGTVFMHETNDTLSAEVDFMPKDPARLKEANFRWVILDAGSYYISTAVNYTTATDGDFHIISAEALDLTWYDYDPETSVSAIAAMATPTLQDIEAIGFQMDATVATNTGVRQYHNFRVNRFTAGASRSVDTPDSLWTAWVGGYMGADDADGLLDHADDDGLNNLIEYAWGGNPTDGNDVGNKPVQTQVRESDTNYIEYVYFERDDAVDRGLSSILEIGTDLVNTNWVDGSSFEIGSGASAISGYRAVTNRIPIDAQTKKFIRLQIEFTP